MSDAVSAMMGAEFSGAVTIRDAGLRGMITLRGDLEDEKLGAALKAVTGHEMPAPRQITEGKKGAVAWMSPDELLLFVKYETAEECVDMLDKALAGMHFLAVNVSDARAMFTLSGAGVREVIAKGAPADLSSRALPIGEIRRSRLGQVAAAVWLSDAETLSLVCFRSVGKYAFDWLSNAAKKDTLPGVIT